MFIFEKGHWIKFPRVKGLSRFERVPVAIGHKSGWNYLDPLSKTNMLSNSYLTRVSSLVHGIQNISGYSNKNVKNNV